MQVITGSAKGLKLKTLDGEATRPTTQRVKEALFSSIQFEVQGRRVLDLFAGSGSLGIEALSRGAEFADFVDNNKAAIDVVKSNLERCKMAEQAALHHTDYKSFLESTDKTFHVILIDAPYGKGLCDKALKVIAARKLLFTGGVIICETGDREALPESVGDLEIARSVRYGTMRLTTYRHGEGEA